MGRTLRRIAVTAATSATSVAHLEIHLLDESGTVVPIAVDFR